MASLILPAPGEDKSILIFEYKNLLKSIESIAINKPIMKIMQNNTLLSSITNFQPNNKANNARITRPIYPLNLSRNTVATTSRGRLVSAAKSILRTTSPPIVEGRNKLKNIPPQKEVMIFLKGRFILIAFKSMCQRKKQKT